MKPSERIEYHARNIATEHLGDAGLGELINYSKLDTTRIEAILRYLNEVYEANRPMAVDDDELGKPVYDKDVDVEKLNNVPYGKAEMPEDEDEERLIRLNEKKMLSDLLKEKFGELMNPKTTSEEDRDIFEKKMLTEAEEDDMSGIEIDGDPLSASQIDKILEEQDKQDIDAINSIVDGDDGVISADAADDYVKDDDEPIEEFTGDYEFLRNDYYSEQQTTVYYEDDDDNLQQSTETFATAQHAFQSNKTLDRDVQVLIRDAGDAKTASQLGRQAPLVDDWDNKRISVMEKVLEDKFGQNFELKIKLLATGKRELIQGNMRDRFWGVDRHGNGDNNLGKLLMKVRDRFLRDEGTLMEILKAKLDRDGLGFLVSWIDENRIH